MTGASDELTGQRGEARADLDEVVAGLRRDRVEDAAHVVRVGEKVLAESLACLMALHGVSRGGTYATLP